MYLRHRNGWRYKSAIAGDVAVGRCDDIIDVNTRERIISRAMTGFTLSRPFRDTDHTMYDPAFERHDGCL